MGPDQVEGFHPFNATVMRAPIPENKMLLAMDMYSGMTDSKEHLQSFVDVMAVYSPDDLVECQVFSLSLKGEALDWFHSLELGAIDGFTMLRNLFGQLYVSSKAQGLT